MKTWMWWALIAAALAGDVYIGTRMIGEWRSLQAKVDALGARQDAREPEPVKEGSYRQAWLHAGTVNGLKVYVVMEDVK